MYITLWDVSDLEEEFVNPEHCLWSVLHPERIPQWYHIALEYRVTHKNALSLKNGFIARTKLLCTMITFYGDHDRYKLVFYWLEQFSCLKLFAEILKDAEMPVGAIYAWRLYVSTYSSFLGYYCFLKTLVVKIIDFHVDIGTSSNYNSISATKF